MTTPKFPDPVKRQVDSFEELSTVWAEIQADYDSGDYVTTLSVWQDELEEIHEQYFLEMRDAEGGKWEALAPSTIAKKGHSKILVETGALRASLIDESASSIREITDEGAFTGLTFGTSDHKSMWHQKGEGVPQRQHVGMSSDHVNELTNDIADATVAALIEKI